MIRIALNGLGRWGNRLVESVQGRSELIQFVAGASRSPDKHAAFSERFGIPVRSYEQVLADPEVDAVLLATPHSLHFEQIVAAAAAGKHVFAEKPLSLTAAGARDSIEACRQAGVAIGHGFNRRFAPSFLAMQQMVAEGRIGKVLHLEGQFSGPSGFALKPGAWRADPAEAPAGAMTARGIHPLDSMIALAGRVETVFAHSGRFVIEAPIDDVTSALLKFEGGATGTIASHHATAEIWRVQVYGSKGWIEMTGDTELVVAPLEGDRERLSYAAADKERAALEAFARAIGGTPYPVSDSEVINSAAVIEAMARSAATGEVVHVSTLTD